MIPIGDSPRSQSTPWVNYLLIGVNIAAFLYMLTLSTALPATRQQAVDDFVAQRATVCAGFEAAPTELDRFYCEWGLQPREFLDAFDSGAAIGGQDAWAVVATLVTSVFLHAGWLHIAGNLLFLWVFGDNVEDRLGHLPYLLFYVVGAMAASLTQVAIDPGSLVPIVGASGGVAAVLGAYFIWYPGATVNVIIPFFILIFIPLPVPAILMIGLWFVQNLLAGYASLGMAAGPEGGVAFFAHIGGFVFGMVLAMLLFNVGRRRRRAAREWQW
jgi:membrane associated rhomboid family serine protease